MRQYYLLSFIRNCRHLPSESTLITEMTTLGTHGVIWCKPPQEVFKTKNEFLMAMLQWFEEIQRLHLTVLPIQSGVSVVQEAHLIEILRAYKPELNECFDKLEGCSEYYLTITRQDQEFAPVAYSSLRENVQSGKEYLERIKVRHQRKKEEVLKVREVIALLCTHLSPWIKDYRSDIPGNRGGGINLSFLVPNVLQKEFCSELQSLLDKHGCQDKWTGPWPPFHFSSFSLKPESYLRRESLNWG